MVGRPFEPGSPGGPGRPRGGRNRLSEAFLEALFDDFRTHGVAAIAAAREESPLGYVRMVASLLPQKMQVERGQVSEMSDAELVEIMRGNRVRERDEGLEDVVH